MRRSTKHANDARKPPSHKHNEPSFKRQKQRELLGNKHCNRHASWHTDKYSKAEQIRTNIAKVFMKRMVIANWIQREQRSMPKQIGRCDRDDWDMHTRQQSRHKRHAKGMRTNNTHAQACTRNRLACLVVRCWLRWKVSACCRSERTVGMSSAEVLHTVREAEKAEHNTEVLGEGPGCCVHSSNNQQ